VIWALLHKDSFCDGPRLCNDDPYEHAPDCPYTVASEIGSANSAFGVLLDRVLSLDFALEKGIGGITIDTIPADEYMTLRLLQAERNRVDREQLEKAKQRGPGK